MTSGSQKSSPEVDFRKSKIITGSRLPEVKKNYESRLPYIKKNIFYFILFFKIRIQNYKTFKYKKDYFKK